jgi:hypothetical protein
LFAALFKDAVAVTGAVNPFISSRIPRILNDPDALLPLGKPGKSISILLDAVFSFGFVTVANTPVAPIIVIGSSGGIRCAVPAPPPPPAQSKPLPGTPAARPKTQFSGDDAIVAGNVRSNVVVVRGDAARTAPVTRMPEFGVPGSAVCTT